MINALRSTRALVDCGFSKEQADTTIKVLMEIMDSKFSTKQDIQFSELAVRSDIEKMEQSIRSDMKGMESRLTTKIMGSMVASVGLMATVMKLLNL